MIQARGSRQAVWPQRWSATRTMTSFWQMGQTSGKLSSLHRVRQSSSQPSTRAVEVEFASPPEGPEVCRVVFVCNVFPSICSGICPKMCLQTRIKMCGDDMNCSPLSLSSLTMASVGSGPRLKRLSIRLFLSDCSELVQLNTLSLVPVACAAPESVPRSLKLEAPCPQIRFLPRSEGFSSACAAARSARRCCCS